MSKKKFYTLLVAYVILFFAWYMFIYLPQVQKLEEVNVKLNEVSQQVSMARNAQINLNNIKKHFNKEQLRLQEEKAKFVKRDQLGKVTKELRNLAKKYNLKLVDFSPGLKDYFAATGEAIVPLPLSITFVGRFISIGKFIEEWKSLPFYLIPEEMTMERLDKNGYDIQAVIEAKLYTWNE